MVTPWYGDDEDRVRFKNAVYDLLWGDVVRAPAVSGCGTIESARLLYAAVREEKKVTDKAVEMLQTQRFEEAQVKAEAEAQVILNAVNDLRVGELVDGVGVRFVKTYRGEKRYVHLAQRVVDANGQKLWFVSGRERALNDLMFESLLAEKGGFENFTVVYDNRPVEGAPLTTNWAGAPSNLSTAPKFDLGPLPSDDGEEA